MPHATREENATAIVLAGGKSARIGRPKALLPIGGEPLVTRVVRTLRTLFDDVVVVTAPGQPMPCLPARVVRDEVAHLGPLSGIRHGLSAARRDLCFVAPCDGPFLDPALVSGLLARAPGCDIVVPRWQQRLQPLHAVYRRDLEPVLAEAIVRGQRRPAAIFDGVRTCAVDEAEIRALDPQGWSFFNINTPDDYRRAVERDAGCGCPDPGNADCTVELFGMARLLTRTPSVPVTVPAGGDAGRRPDGARRPVPQSPRAGRPR